MKDELAERLFDRVMPEELDGVELMVSVVQPLQRMAAYKYDEYGGYSPGVKFMETLAVWLHQLEPEERQIALTYVQEELIFISSAEMDHAIRTAYVDHVRPRLVRTAAKALQVAPYQVETILNSDEFRQLQRSTLFLGLADGARLDQFRRANRDLVHDQFSVTYAIAGTSAEGFLEELQAKHEGAVFSRLVLVDDFSGSGYTMLRKKGEVWGGKLFKINEQIRQLVEQGIVAKDYDIHVLLYVCTERARDALLENLELSDLGWTLSVVQLVPDSVRIDDTHPFAALCHKYHDPVVDDRIKTDAETKTAALGFRDGRLPLVLFHNTPNNSVGLLWENTKDYSGSEARRFALFPRHERHKADR